MGDFFCRRKFVASLFGRRRAPRTGWQTSFEWKGIFAMKVERSMKRTLCGTIFPVTWDKNDNVVGIVIDPPDQDGYLIDQNRRKELLAYIRRKVKISGTMMREEEGGDLIFKVKNTP